MKKQSAKIKRLLKPDYNGHCENCGSSPTVPMSGLCGPCHFGTADAVGGGWWSEQTDDLDEDFAMEHIDHA